MTQPDDDRRFFELFGVLRKTTVEVARDLADRVRGSTNDFDDRRGRGPQGAEVAGSMLAEALNIMTGWLAPHPADQPEDDDADEP